jgi:hypothetical protein
MNFWKKGLLLVITTILVGSLASSATWAARRKGGAKAPPAEGKISSDPGAATIKEAGLLKWGAVDPPSTGKNDEFFFRGVFLESVQQTDAEGKTIKNAYVLKFLPVEIVENEERSIGFDNFANGINVKREVLHKDFWKNLNKGNVVEVRQWYEVVEEGGQGHAKMMGFIYHQDILPYPTAPLAYIKQPGLYMEQYLNALKGVEISSDKGSGDQIFKDALDALASSAPDPQVKEKATALLAQIFSAQPSGKPMLKPVEAAPAPTGKKKKG